MVVRRADIFLWFLDDNPHMPESILGMIFKEATDEDLAKAFNLKVLTKGRFIA